MNDESKTAEPIAVSPAGRSAADSSFIIHHSSLLREAVATFRGLQDRLTSAVEAADGTGRFADDRWERPGGGGGRTRVLAGGAVFEKAGVGFSEVFGELTPEFAKQLPGDGLSFTASGVSLVFHPWNPHVPTVHMNVRVVRHGAKTWFGGGADLTPYYPVREDVVHFHRAWKAVCDRHAPLADHAAFKAECDRYFYSPHRGEHRGVGGIFFEHLPGDGPGLAFVRAVGDAFLDSYLPIVARRKDTPVTPAERHFQELRRGRYVEFNLLHDRGTVFGLKTNGRTESILMSLPPAVRYEYGTKYEPGSREAELTDTWLKPRDWVGESGGE